METIRVETGAREEFIEITGKAAAAVSQNGWDNGVLFIFVPHTTAGIFINENADPTVQRDINMVSEKIVPGNLGYSHGEGNSPAHMKSVLFNQSLFVFVEDGALVLGTWQGIFFGEFDGPRSRNVFLKFIKG